jgi:hypothetical protein
MTEPRLCKDCRWAVDRGAGLRTQSRSYEWFCGHSSSLRPAKPPSLVTGEIPPRAQMGCEEARAYDKDLLGGPIHCGREGQFWEPLEVGFGPKP